MNGLESIWHEYDSFENNLNKLTVNLLSIHLSTCFPFLIFFTFFPHYNLIIRPRKF